MQAESTRSLAGNRWVRPSVPEDAPAIIALMQEAGLHPHTELAHLHWKYWRERSDWSGSRSFVLTNGRDLLAHGAVVPGTVQWGSHQARMIHMIDWAARRDAIGAGVLLMKHVGRMTDFLLGVGGSKDTLSIMPRIGYRQWGAVRGYVRTLDPRGILQRPTRSRWKRAPRMVRSALWCITAPRRDLGGWVARRIGIEQIDQIAPVLPVQRPGLSVFGRSAALMRHVLACPIVSVELYALERDGRIGGYFLLSYAPGQARLADCWMKSEDPADWRALAHAAVHEAKRHGGMAELTAWASRPEFARVLQACGFHGRLKMPIYVRASGDEAVPQECPRVQMLESDEFYLYIGRNQLWA